MCYPDRNYYITLLFQLLEEFEALDTFKQTERRGPLKYTPTLH